MSRVYHRAIPAAAAAFLALVSCQPGVPPRRWNVLLVTLETTRADHLGAYGYARPTSPYIDDLARGGVLFERASSVSPRTNPSLASIMTSRTPQEHGVRNLLINLDAGQRTLAEVLRDAGWRTGAVQTHPRLVASSGFSQGFGTYDDDHWSHHLAADACLAAARWIRDAARGERPWFLWIHLMDPHWSYAPPDPWRGRFGNGDGRPWDVYRDVHEGRTRMGEIIFRNRMPPDEVQAFVDLYDGEIAYADDSLGGLLALLDALDLRGRTLVVVTADHGESLGEHDYFFEHGDFGTEPEIHVPLLFAGPEDLPAGTRVKSTVATLDLAPTVLDLLHLPPEPAFRGESLLPVMRGREGDRTCFGESGKAFHPENERRVVEGVAGKWRWVRRGPYKMVHQPLAAGGARRVLYDLAADPGETRDVAALHPEVATELGKELDAWIAADPGSASGPPRLDPDTLEKLHSLGYTD